MQSKYILSSQSTKVMEPNENARRIETIRKDRFIYVNSDYKLVQIYGGYFEMAKNNYGNLRG